MPLLLALGIWALAADLADQSFAAQIVESTSPVAAGSSVREFLSYMWQFYLPRTPVQYEYRVHGRWSPAHQHLGDRTAGPPSAGSRSGSGSGCTGCSAPSALLSGSRRWWRSSARDGASTSRVAAFLALAALALLAGLHWTDYRQLEAGARGFMQTRYLFPLIGVFGLALAGALSLAAGTLARGRRRRHDRGAVRLRPALARARAGAVLCVASPSSSRVAVVAIAALGLAWGSSLAYSIGVRPAIIAATLKPGDRACQAPIRTPNDTTFDRVGIVLVTFSSRVPSWPSTCSTTRRAGGWGAGGCRPAIRTSTPTCASRSRRSAASTPRRRCGSASRTAARAGVAIVGQAAHRLTDHRGAR